jgi:hypothetical protein
MTWTKSAIRAARQADLAPILTGRGYRLHPLTNDNFGIVPGAEHTAALAGLVVKRNFWTWPDHDLSGNTIDFLVKVEKLTFHQAMKVITGATL